MIVERKYECRVPFEYANDAINEVAWGLIDANLMSIEAVALIIEARWAFEAALEPYLASVGLRGF